MPDTESNRRRKLESERNQWVERGMVLQDAPSVVGEDLWVELEHHSSWSKQDIASKMPQLGEVRGAG